MDLPEAQIEELRELYRSETGENISAEEAKELGAYLVGLVRAVYQI
jgi:hypothetical protein